ISLARDLETLQDKMSPFPQAEAERAVAAAFGKPLREVFASFGPAVAAASIAQVHRADVAEAGEDLAQRSARPRESGGPGPPIPVEQVALDSRLRGNERSGGRRAVAVKVLRPGIERRFRVDLDALT